MIIKRMKLTGPPSWSSESRRGIWMVVVGDAPASPECSTLDQPAVEPPSSSAVLVVTGRSGDWIGSKRKLPMSSRHILSASWLVTTLAVVGFVWKYLEAAQQKGVAEDSRREAEDSRREAEHWKRWAQAEEALPGMKFVPLPKATFYMGGGGGEAGKKTEIKEDFEIAAHPVTQGQWEWVMGTKPSYFSRQGRGDFLVKDIEDEELKLFPVETVSWDDAQEFLKRVNEKEKGRGYLYRLPTEAEWEYACRGGATSEKECSYHFYFDKPTNDLSSTQANFEGNYPFGDAKKGPFVGRTTKVGSYAPNKLGLYDMHGNVWQWTSTQLDSGRVCRGGCWSFVGESCQAAIRSKVEPSARTIGNGLRVARVLRSRLLHPLETSP